MRDDQSHNRAFASCLWPVWLVRSEENVRRSNSSKDERAQIQSLRASPSQALVIDYLGVVHNNDDVDVESDYDLVLERRQQDVIGIDARHFGNEVCFYLVERRSCGASRYSAG